MSQNKTMDFHGMLLVGSSARNAGKTEFSCRIISKLLKGGSLVAAKVTAVDEANGLCPRGGKGCGVCASLKGPFDITEETNPGGSKDTSRLLAAGASRVLWMRVLKSHILEGMQALQESIGSETVWLCESNSVRSAVRPDVFLMVEESSGKYKASAAKVAGFADRKVHSDHDLQSFDFDFERLSVEDGRWALRENAAAIILAGGESKRMGSDKGMLPLRGGSMIEHVVKQVRHHFDETIISAAGSEHYAFLDLPVAVDAEPGLGPLMGIVSALKGSSRDLNFVTTCDVPDIDMPTVRNMLHIAETGGMDIVVPRCKDGGIEPLHGVYHRRVVPLIEEALRQGQRKVRSVFEQCQVDYYDLPEGREIVNLNTKEDYDNYCKGDAAL